MANQLKTGKSGFGSILEFIGYSLFMLMVSLWVVGLTSEIIEIRGMLVITPAFVFSGIFFIFLGTLIQKVWNIEFYLSHLAQNTYSVPVPKQTFQEKPISAPKEPNKPSNPQSDMSKYAPK